MSRTRKPEIVASKIRLAAELVARLETAAKKRNVSYNHEAARRLGVSFQEEDAFGGEDGRRTVHLIASAFVLAGSKVAGTRNASRWLNNPKAYDAAMVGAIEAMLIARPGATFETFMLQLKSLEGRLATRLLAKGETL